MKRVLSLFLAILLFVPVFLLENTIQAYATQSRTSNFSLNGYTPTGNAAADICAVALLQEGRTGSQFGYSEDWCADFVSDCAIIAGASSAIPANGSVYYLWNGVLNAGGQVVSFPQPGDLAVMDWSYSGSTSAHVELVYQTSGNYVYTIGGNTGSTGSLYTNKVTKRNGMLYTHSAFVKFVHPNYSSSSSPDDTLTLTNAVYPSGDLAEGSIFNIAGTITSAVSNISNVTVGVYTPSGSAATEKSVNPNAKTYNLLNINNDISFGNLTVGSYYYRITATNATGLKTLMNQSFRVVSSGGSGGGDPTTDTLTLSGANYPSTIHVGGSFSITGTISSAVSNISSVTVGVYYPNGTEQQSKTVYPNSRTYNINNLDNDIRFGTIPSGGTYYYRITAANASCSVTLLNMEFNVTDEFELAGGIYPKTSINKGSSYSISGILRSRSAISSVTVGVYSLTGDAELENTQNVSGGYYNSGYYTWNIQNHDSAITFRDLSAGSHYFRIIATNATYTNKVVINQKFIVIDTSHSHSLTHATAQDATCTTAGCYEHWHCSSCGMYFSNSTAMDQVLEEDVIIPSYGGHTYTYAVTATPTISATGTLKGTCSRCSGTTNITLPKLTTTDYNYTVVTAATCTANGTGRYTWKTTTYGTYYFDVTINNLGHNYSYAVTAAPTTSATGTLKGTCSRCSGTTNITLPKLTTTDYNYTVVTAATCTANGTGRYTWKTTTYGTYYFDVTINNLGHNYSYAVTAAPTTSATGTLKGTCSRCSGTTNITLPKLTTTDYNYTVVTAAACTANGTGRYTWKTTTYGTYYFDVVIPMFGHSYANTVTAPTCTSQGFTTHTCSTCGYSYVDNYTAALGHDYAYIVTATPTTDAAGMLTGTCSRCSGSTVITLPVLNTTDYNCVIVKPATCMNTGKADYTWKITTYGTYTFTVILPFSDHEYNDVVTAPTCTSRGYTTHTCIYCGESYRDSFTSALGHNYNYAITTAPTAVATGVLTGTCSRCSVTDPVTLPKLNTTDYTYILTSPATCTADGAESYTWKNTEYGTIRFDFVLPMLGHDYVAAVTEPGCTEGGYTTHTCSRCGDSYVDGETGALGHSFGSWAQSSTPTCTEPGYITRSCSRCGETESIEIAPLGHLPGEAVQENYVEPTPTQEGGYDMVVRCTRCNAILSSEHTTLPATGSMEPIETDELRIFSSISVGTDMVVTWSARKADVGSYERFWIEVVKHTPDGDETYLYGADQDEALDESTSAWQANFRHIFAKEMGVDIEARVYAEDANGQIYRSPAKNTNIRDYLGGRLTATNNTVSQRVLAADLLNYGAAAQIFMNYDTGHLVNEELTAEQLAKLDEYETKTLPAVEKTNTNYRPAGASNILFNSVSLDNEVILTLTVRAAAGANVKVLMKDHETGTVLETLDTAWNGSNYAVNYTGLGADKMRTQYDFVAWINGAETGNIRTWSIEGYVGELRSGNNQPQINVANALLAYGDSAAAYFAAQ